MKKVFITLILAFTSLANASEKYTPMKPVKVIIPYSANSGVARFFRILDEYAVSKNITLVPEFKPGAGAMIGLNYAAGGTVNANNSVVLTVLSDTISKDPARKFNKDHFTPITAFVRPKMYIVSSPTVPVNNLAELFSTLRQNPGQLSWAVANTQAPEDLRSFSQTLGIKFDELIITRFNGGNSQAVIAGGHIDLGIYPAATVAPLINNQQLKLIGTYRQTDAPTKNIQSLDQFVTLTKDDAYSLFTLPNADQEFIKFWNNFTREFQANDAVKQRIKDNHFYMFDHGLTDVNRILKLLQSDMPIKLTQREEEIKDLIQFRGLSNRQISNQLSIGESCVKTHVTSILKKYGLKSRTQLAVIDNALRAS